MPYSIPDAHLIFEKGDAMSGASSNKKSHEGKTTLQRGSL